MIVISGGVRPATPPLVMDVSPREILENLARSHTAAHREVTHARASLLAAEGVANTVIAAELSMSPASVVTLRAGFLEEGVAKIGRVRPGRGRKPEIPHETIDMAVRLTRETTPEGETHWRCRSTAKVAGVSPPRSSGSGRPAGSNLIW